MTEVIGLASARRSMPMRRSSKPSSRNAGSHEMSQLDLRAIEGRRDDDLVTTIIRAIELAKLGESGSTVDLLKMALLNEGIRLANDLSKQAFPAARKGSSLPRLNLVRKEQATSYGQPNSIWRSAHPRAARPGRSLVPDRARPAVCGTHLSIEGPAPSADPTARASSTVTGRLLSSFPTRD